MTTKGVLIIYNPVSGQSQLRRSKEYIRKYLEENDVLYTWYDTKPGWIHTIDLDLGAYERILAVGGDGTVREVAQLLLDQGKRIPLGIVPQGSANVLAHSLGIPIMPLPRVLRCALGGTPKPVDAIRINEKYCALIGAGQGYDSVFINGATRTLKRRIGFFAYLFSFFRTYFFERSRPYKIVIDGDRSVVIGKSVLVLNALALAGIPVHRTITPHDGLLNVIVLNPRVVGDMLRIAGSLILRRPLHRVPKVQSFVGKEISVHQKDGQYIQIDGDVLRAKVLQAKVLPGAVLVATSR